MAATQLTISDITNEALMVLENSLGLTARINRQYDDKFAREGAKIGNSINIRLPVRYTVSTGEALDLQEPSEESTALVLDQRKHVDFAFGMQDLLLNIDRFSDRYIKPAIAALANEVDRSGFELYKEVANGTGIPGTIPTSILTFMTAKGILDDCACPRDSMRYCALDPKAEVTLVNAEKTLFHPRAQVSEQNLMGEMGQLGGLNFFMDQNVIPHTCGTVASSTPLTNGTTAHGATSIVTDGWNSGATTLKKGDIISLAGVYRVNPQSRQATRDLAQFVCTADQADSSGNITIPISPAIYLTGAKQNCSYASSTTAVADGVAVYVNGYTGSSDLGTYVSAKVSPQQLVFHRDAFVLGTADLPLPGGVHMAARAASKKAGLSIRIVQQYDIRTDRMPCRLDILYGWKAVRPELACRVHA